jgi:proliferating cell nuclear antigen
MSDDAVVSGIVAADTLQSFIDVHTPLVDEGRVHFNTDGLTTSVVEAANVAMHEDVSLSSAAFEDYVSPGAATIGVSFNRLDEVLGPANAGTLVEFVVDMETRHLELQYDGTEHRVALIDPQAIRQEPDDPGLELPNTATLAGDDLDRALSVCDLYSDHIDIVADPDARELSFAGQGDVDEGSVTYTDEDLIDASVDESCKSIFTLEILAELADPIPGDAEVQLTFGDEFPVKLSWETCEGHLTVRSMCAPRIQSK